MTKFDLKENSIEVSRKDRKSIKEGIALCAIDTDPLTIASFDSLDDAKKELKKYKSCITELSGSYLIEEYYIEENIYDEDGDWLDFCEIHECSKMVIELVEEPSFNQLATFDNMKDAEDALDDYIYRTGNEAHLSF